MRNRTFTNEAANLMIGIYVGIFILVALLTLI